MPSDELLKEAQGFVDRAYQEFRNPSVDELNARLDQAQEEADQLQGQIHAVEQVKVKSTGLVDDPDVSPVPGAPPQHLTTTRRIGDRLYVAGRGDREAADILFVETAVLEEEASESQLMSRGQELKQKPRYLKGPAGSIFTDLCMSVGIDINKQYFTALVKWLLPKAQRLRPKRDAIAWGLPTLHNEIKDIAPKIIVCIGKPAFDAVCPGYKLPLSDIQGAWFYSQEYNARIYVMDNLTKPVLKPEYVEAYRVDLLEIRKMWDKVRGIEVPQVPTEYQTVRTSGELVSLVSRLIAENRTLLSVDCEWGGNNHVGGKLRSLQICWAEGKAAYIRFMDDKGNYAFDIDYAAAGEILKTWLDEEDVKYIGQHISADLPWMAAILGLQWYGKVIMDVEFGQQTADEYEGLGLERLAMKYTDLGRYDIDLVLWRKENKLGPSDGYAFVPDEILIPYGCKDVDVPMRAYPHILRQLVQQDLLGYFYDVFLPLVTDVFTNFALVGLPMNITRMDELRDLFSYVRDRLSEQLQEAVVKEAKEYLFVEMSKIDIDTGALAFMELESEDLQEAYQVFKAFVGPERLAELQPFWDHYTEAPRFNIRSGIQMRRWLFEVKRLQPVKSTNNKDKGLPSIPWDKVLNLPTSRQKEYTPAVDKQTLQIYGNDPVISQLLELNAVGNLVKAFLKPADIDPETGELVKENGLHFWVAPDGRIHGQMSATETGRPRSWKPNVYNLPSWINKKIMEGVKRCLDAAKAAGTLPERFVHYLSDAIPSIRACVDSEVIPPLPGSQGWCLVESDYQTAEIRGLAFISGDENMIRIITEPDPQFVIAKGGREDEDDDVIRVSYADDCGIPAEKRDPRLLWVRKKTKKVFDLVDDGTIPEGLGRKEYAYQKMNALLKEQPERFIMIGPETYLELTPVTEADLEKNEDGTSKHTRCDLHWSLAEMVNLKPRELMNKKVERGAAKVGNFSSAYGASPNTLERKIESDTGSKPPEGTGQAILDALRVRQPVATAFLEWVEGVPAKEGGKLVAASGRIRHCYVHRGRVQGLNERAEKGLLSSIGREFRNFFMQNSVADTAARAANWLLSFAAKNQLMGRPIILLYDSLVTLCPVEERHIWKLAHQLFMCSRNGWEYHGRVLRYPVDTEYNTAWSWKPSKEWKARLYDDSWAPVEEDHKHVMLALQKDLAYYADERRCIDGPLQQEAMY